MSAATRRVGVLVPAGNEVHEREFARLRPAGVEFSFRGFSYPQAGSLDFCADLALCMQPGLQQLVQWGAELVLVGCTTASMACNADRDQARLEGLAGVPVISAARATLLACTALGARALAVVTPYGAANNRIVADFLESQSLRVTALRGLDLDRSLDVWRASAANLQPEQLLALAAEVATPEADALYLPCTGVESLRAIAQFERQTGKHALSSVQAGFWSCMRALGIDGRQSGSGQLLERWDF